MTLSAAAPVAGHSSVAVSRAAAALAGEVVTVPGARLTGSWADRQDGTYVSAWTAETAGEGLKATLKYAGWESAAESPAYVITAGEPAYAESSVATDRTTYTAGDTMKVTVKLKDAQGNDVSGKAAELARDGVVVVPNTEEQPEGVSWSEGEDGEYTADYTAKTAGSGLEVTLRYGKWSKRSPEYEITPRPIKEMTGTITANRKSDFATTGSEKFPTTGFKGAKFTLNPDNFSDGEKTAGDYTLKAGCGGSEDSCSWVDVSGDGEVSFTGDAASGTRKVTITATPKDGAGDVLTYSFTVGKWFRNLGDDYRNWEDTNSACAAAGLRMPSHDELTNAPELYESGTRATGTLWGEWGDFSSYSEAGWVGRDYWASDSPKEGRHYGAWMNYGELWDNVDRDSARGVCVRGL